jgi:hypothetical protein
MESRLATAQKEIKSLRKQVEDLTVQRDTLMRDILYTLEASFKLEEELSLQRILLFQANSRYEILSRMLSRESESHMITAETLGTFAYSQGLEANKYKKRNKIKNYIIAGLVGGIGIYAITR